MITPQVHRSTRIKRRYVGIVVLCFCAVWLMPVGYGQADQVSRMIADLKDRHAQVRRDAASGLGYSKDPRAVGPLSAALKDADARVQREAAEALGKIKDPRAVEPLIAALKDSDKDVRKYAARTLGEINDPHAVEPLLAALKEPDLAVIAGAYSFFIGRAEKGSEDALIQALNASDYSKSMAEDYLNCGNSALEAAAREWAWKHRYQITAGGGGGTVRWGSRR